MKKTLIIAIASITLNSCATVLGGKITETQTKKPKAGEQQRKVRPGYLIADVVLFWPFVIVDFATGAIYKK